MAALTGFVPYCGAPPIPGKMGWNFDPLLIGALAAIAALYCWRATNARHRAGAGIALSRAVSFYAGIVVIAAAMISPLCNLGVALFSARVTQHMAVTLIASPLLVIGLPPPRRSFVPAGGLCGGAAVLFAAVLWFWHLAGPYDQTLRSNLVYWLMELSLFATSLALWFCVFATAQSKPGDSFVSSLFTGFQMCLLGALLTFSRQPWFAVHAQTTWAWGISQIADQRLGGLIMWVPGGILATGYTVLLLARFLVQPAAQPAAASSGSRRFAVSNLSK